MEKVRTKNVDSQIWKQADYKLNLVEERHGKRKLDLTEELGQEDFQRILVRAKETKADVLHIKTHRKPYLKRQGELIQLRDEIAEQRSNVRKTCKYTQWSAILGISFH